MAMLHLLEAYSHIPRLLDTRTYTHDYPYDVIFESCSYCIIVQECVDNGSKV